VSFAHSIRDAGIALVAFLAKCAERSSVEPPTFMRPLLLTTQATRVLELGTGCGVVGISFAQLFPRCNIVLSDLPEAMEILDINIHRATPASNTKLIRLVLDWHLELPAALETAIFDLVLISDCTYNSDRFVANFGSFYALTLYQSIVLPVFTAIELCATDCLP